MDNIDKKIQEIVTKEIHPSENYKNTINSTLQSLENKKYSNNRLRMAIASVCVSAFLISGVVFAKDIEKIIKGIYSEFGLGDGVSVAVDNGYIGISNEDSDFQNVKILENDSVIDNINVKMSINKFMITDDILSLEMNLEYENKLNNYVKIVRTKEGNISYEESYAIEIEDLLIIDEDNNIIYSNLKDTESFENLCEKNDLKISYPEKNEYSVNHLVKAYNENETKYSSVEFIFNLMSSSGFSNPKKLNIYFTKIKLFNDYLNGNVTDEIMLTGDWKFDLDVPENMYNRTSSSYQVISSNNQDFNVYETKLTDTKFEIGIEISNIREPEYPKVLSQIENEIIEKNKINEKNGYDFSFGSREDIVKFYGNEEYANLYENYWKERYIIGDTITLMLPWISDNNKDYQCYVENQNGEKFKLKENDVVNRGFTHGNKYDYYAECEMNKYTATDKIKIVIVVAGEPFDIQMKK